MSVAWHVLGDQITQEVDLAPGNQGLYEVKIVPYMIDSGPAAGTVHQVKIPVSRFTPEIVAEAINVDVNRTHGVASIRVNAQGQLITE